MEGSSPHTADRSPRTVCHDRLGLGPLQFRLSPSALILVLALPCLLLAAQAEPKHGVIRGRVSEATTDEPLAGASVWLFDTEFGTSCNSDGSYAVHCPPGPYIIVASFVTWSESTVVTVTAGDTVDLDFALFDADYRGLKKAEVTPSWSQERVITDEYSGPPRLVPPERAERGSHGCIAVYVAYGDRFGQPGVRVTLFEDERVWQTNVRGICYLDSVPAGEHVVMLYYPDSAWQTLHRFPWWPAAPQARIADVIAGDTILVTVAMVPAPPHHWKGAVLDSLTGEPIEGATVRLMGSGGLAGFGPFKGTSDSLGEFSVSVESVSLCDPPIWRFEYTVDHPGYIALWGTKSGSDLPRHFFLQDTNRSAVAGRVADSLTGQPLAGAYVSISGSTDPYSSRFSTLEDGTFEMLHPPGACIVSVRALAHLRAKRTLDLVSGHPTHLDFKLLRDENRYKWDVIRPVPPGHEATATLPARGAGSTEARLRAILGSAYIPWANADSAQGRD